MQQTGAPARAGNASCGQSGHRTLKAQGIDREPTTHLGPAVSRLARKGIASEVENRIRAERAAESQRKLEQAAELKALECESRAVQSQIIELSTDISAALAARDAKRDQSLSKDREASMDAKTAKSMSPDETQKAAVEKWLKYCERQAEKGRAKGLDSDHSAELERTRDKSKDHTLDDDFSL